MNLTVILPMYNEGSRIVDTLDKINEYLTKKNHNYNIIVIDDCSTDNSYNEVFNYIYHNYNNKVLIYKNSKNSGKGFSVRRGLMIGDSDYYLFTDCDLSCPISQLEKMLPYIKQYDLLLSSRYIKGRSVILRKQSMLRRVYSRCFNFLINYLLDLDVCDTQCGFKLYSRKCRDLITSKSVINGFSFDVEHIFITKVNDLVYEEVPITWSDNKIQSFNFKKIFKMFTEIMLIHRIKLKKGYEVNK